MLLCGLDGSGKTTLIKKYCQDLEKYHAEHGPKGSQGGVFANKDQEEEKKDKYGNRFAEFYHTTPYINIEKITLPDGSMPCVVYDMSGQGRYRDSW